MMTIRCFLILILFAMISFNSFGQKIKYRDYKNDLLLDNYREIIDNEKYSPFVAGVCNYLIPSSGYFYVGEPIRGVLVFSSQIATSSIFVSGLVKSLAFNEETGKSPKGARAIMFSGIIATGLIQIWSIYDVVQIAKIKNLAYQETKITLDLKPDIFLLSHSENNSAICGLKLSINF